ncbi:MAG: hypothetical protein AAF740_02850, partial [Bacteroidota bacterium]
MNIGILIGEFKDLKNWELEIIKGILNHPSLELSVLIQDGRVGLENPLNTKNRFQRLLNSKNIFGKTLFHLQSRVETKLFPRKHPSQKEEIIATLTRLPLLKLKPQRKGYFDIFSEEDVQDVIPYKLDILLRHEFNIIRGTLLEVPKYGIWSFHHGDNRINRGGPPGFWETLLKEPYIGVTLQQLTPKLDGGLIIDRAYFNRHWSQIKTRNDALEASVS